MPIPLEDQFIDIIAKAQRGLKLADSELLQKTGLNPEALAQLRNGEVHQESIRKLAAALGLHPGALMGLAENQWRPEPVRMNGVMQFNTPFDDMTVNSYLVWDETSKSAAAFDTGTDCTELLEFAQEQQLKIEQILLTHTHGDHVFELDRLKEKTGAQAFVNELEPISGANTFSAGAAFRIGKLQVETRHTWGHSRGGTTFVVHGLERPVAVVGDALFAGSMGGGMISYEEALRTNREQLFTLPPETLVCPGHGPMTTIGEELRHNPFFAR
jgi:hydroxyacylglutathione hydrolase